MIALAHPGPLVDSFDRRHTYLRISLTDRCNLRCTYCMPEEGIAWTPAAHLLQEDEIIKLAALFANMGVSKIRLTGGEPLLRKDLVSIIAGLSVLPGIKSISITTNGVTLAGKAAELRAAGLTGLTISLDSLNAETYALMARRDRLTDALRGIDDAINAGFAPLKINCVIVRGVNDNEILDFVAWSQKRPIEMRFIEYMPFPGNQWAAQSVMSYREMIAQISGKHTLSPVVGDPSDVGKRFRVDGGATMISFVSSMTDSFCNTCNRLRLTADGQIKSCLFHPAECNLRDALRQGTSDSELIYIIRAAIWAKPEAHPAMEELLKVENRSMIAIGG